MFIVDTEKWGRIKVSFRHVRDWNPEGTSCRIEDQDGNEIITIRSLLHPKDVFCKNTGRKVSLSKCVLPEYREDKHGNWVPTSKPYLEKEDRTAVWTTYHAKRDGVDLVEKELVNV